MLQIDQMMDLAGLSAFLTHRSFDSHLSVTEVLLKGATFMTHKVSNSCSLQQHISSSFCDPGFNNCSAQCITENKVLEEGPLLAEDSSS